MEARQTLPMTPLFDAPQRSMQSLLHADLRLKRRYLRVAVANHNEQGVALLEASAEFLELCLAACATVEAIVESGAADSAAIEADLERIVRFASGVSGLDIVAVAARSERMLRVTRRESSSDDLAVTARELHETLPRIAGSVLAGCPIEYLAKLAEAERRPDLGHRCAIAYDRLQGYVERSAPGADEKFRTIGHAYADGRLELAEVAAITGLSTEDVVVRLEEFGFSRTVESVRLSTEQRRLRLTKLAKARAARGGRPEPSRERVRRDTVATQRIEGIDARPWLRRDVD